MRIFASGVDQAAGRRSSASATAFRSPPVVMNAFFSGSTIAGVGSSVMKWRTSLKAMCSAVAGLQGEIAQRPDGLLQAAAG